MIRRLNNAVNAFFGKKNQVDIIIKHVIIDPNNQESVDIGLKSLEELECFFNYLGTDTVEITQIILDATYSIERLIKSSLEAGAEQNIILQVPMLNKFGNKEKFNV